MCLIILPVVAESVTIGPRFRSDAISGVVSTDNCQRGFSSDRVAFAPLCDPLSCKVPFYIHLCMYFSSIFVPVSEVLIWVLLIVQFYADICHML